MKRSAGQNEKSRRCEDEGRAGDFHGFTCVLAWPLCAVVVVFSKPGGGKMGGRSWECPRFCTSISEKSMAGGNAATGTLPLSAPQTALKTCLWSPVVLMRGRGAGGGAAI